MKVKAYVSFVGGGYPQPCSQNPRMSSYANNHGPTYTVLALGKLEVDMESVSSQYLVNTKQQIWDLEILYRSSSSRGIIVCLGVLSIAVP